MTPPKLRLDKDIFLATHWQRRPLLIRNAIDGFRNPLVADELAGLALEPDVESRIIEQCGGRWLCHHGPFSERDFRRDTPWTLLVQAVDHHVPDVAALRTLMDFLPRWRIDDIMVSYAVDGGGVGPHYDNYDVFLLQGEGRRRWRLGQHCSAETPLLPHEDLRILRDFTCSQEYLLEPGDMLYIPPGVAHWGVARGACTTYSIGFRAPRVRELVTRWVDRLLDELDPELFYSDSHIEPVTRCGEIRPRDLERVAAQLQAAIDQEVDMSWFGELVTEPRYPCDDGDDEYAQARALLRSGPACIDLSPAARVAWQQEAAGIRVFANGESRLFAHTVLACVLELCEAQRLEGEFLARMLGERDSAGLLDFLLETGSVYVE